MSELLSLLCDGVRARGRENEVALLLSGGIDSLSVGVALQETGKTVRAYTYELQGYPSRDRPKAEAIARHFDWPLRVVTVPTHDVCADFIRLAVEERCEKKVHFECTFPLLYVVPEIQESEVWSGWNADSHYGNSREVILEQARMAKEGVPPSERKERFDHCRKERYQNFHAPASRETWWYAHRLAVKHGKRLLDPYADDTIRQYFFQFDHDQLSSLAKPFVREALVEKLRGLPERSIAVGVRLQKGGRVQNLFQTLLDDSTVNRFERRYSSVSALTQRWGREVKSNPSSFDAELACLPHRSGAAVRTAGLQEYQPYTMQDVRNASMSRRFSVVSTFAGGGGSSTGYRLAGGSILLANEFVPEAARTYLKNFPDCPVDGRDIREVVRSTEGFLASAGLKVRELDVLDGSPPCCEFSVAGNGISDQNVPRKYSDVMQKNIATLSFEFVELAAKALPKVAIMENVPGLAHSGKRDILERIVRALRFPEGEEAGRAFYANWSVLSANDFGVAQKRRRLFIIGVRRDVGEAVGIKSDEDVMGLFPTPTHSGVSIRSALTNLRRSAAEINPWRRSAMVSRLGGLIRVLPKSPTKLTRLSHVWPGYTRDYSLTRCSWDLPAPTLIVSGQRPNGMTGVVHPDEDRKFTLPELKRLTGLPDDFILTGTLAQASERICRMVPPLLTKAIAESVYSRVLSPYYETMTVTAGENKR